MRKLIGLFLFVGSSAFGQPCVDPSLIDSTAICPMVYNPVCGCNDITYENDCIAVTLGGVTSWTLGPCQPTELDTCMEIPVGIDFGACAMALGVIRQNDSCFSISGCSMIGSNGVDYSGYFYNSLFGCNAACINDTMISLSCIDTSLIDWDVLCPGVIDPVCGCDSVNYQNSCIAVNYFGITSFQQGECTGAGIPDNMDLHIELFPNPSNEKVFLKGNKLNQVSTYTICALDGRTILKGGYTNSIEISSLTAGQYVVRLFLISGEEVVRTFVKE